MIRAMVNLARHPIENRRRVWVLWGGASAGLLLLLLVLSAVAATGRVRTRAVERRTDELHAQLATLLARQGTLALQLQNPATRSALANAAYLNQLLDRKAVSWTLLFERLESIMPDDVELVSLRPLQRGGANAVDLVFASDTLPPAIDFVRRLEESGDFAEARVEREEMNQTSGPGQAAPLGPRFQIEVTAIYRPHAHEAGPEANPEASRSESPSS